MSTKLMSRCVQVLSLACNDMCDEKIVANLEKASTSYQLPSKLEQNQEGCMAPEKFQVQLRLSSAKMTKKIMHTPTLH